ncbi:MAG: hypothetical protein RIQ47_609 [Bacteroidota bacterium]|jgi:uncharacterized integral membrane protein (TIGR00698 family)
MNSAPSAAISVLRQLPFYILLLVVLLFQITPGESLLLGLLVGLFFVQPHPSVVKKSTKYLLQAAVVGLGFGMNFKAVVAAGSDGFLFTLFSLTIALGLGYLLGRWMKLDNAISYLISVGTAICGGSAIAAVSQAMRTDERNISVSIGIVFILNAVALFIFPPIGHWLGLSQHEFGVWSAIAIHDTSSVVGAAAQYGDEALQVATTIKLARALWIIPLTALTARYFKSGNSTSGFPWFILLFLAASAATTYFNFSKEITTPLVSAAKAGFSITLFLIGTGITRDALRKVGFRPMLHGVLLWLIIMSAALSFLLLER